MSLRLTFFRKTFNFNFKARTSRGLMKDKTSWFIRMVDGSDPQVEGIGECGPLPGLSQEAAPDFESHLRRIVSEINEAAVSPADDHALSTTIPPEFSSIAFGVETALLDLRNGGKRIIFENGFVHGEPIDINGLIWMGDMDFMMDQINKKIADGFTCIKLKVGGLDFDRECDVLDYIRKRYFRQDITIRLDANGAFKTGDALYKLGELQKFRVHSIEQPIKPGLEEMEELCRKSPIPVAFDEELIAKNSEGEKRALLERLRPAYIVLKPTLHGGFRGCGEWISLAETMGIGWWITSALESTIGLNAICQFAARYNLRIPQGLGTGAIYRNNFEAPLTVKQGKICYDSNKNWEEINEGDEYA